MIKVTCFGEVLWDVFPTHKKIGGAPLNVALRLHSFDVDAGIVSRIGDDQDGEAILQYLGDHNMNSTFLQIDDTYKTGCVNVTLDSYGSATYEIEKPVAWDHIQLNEDIINQVKQSDAFIFGSLINQSIGRRGSVGVVFICKSGRKKRKGKSMHTLLNQKRILWFNEFWTPDGHATYKSCFGGCLDTAL